MSQEDYTNGANLAEGVRVFDDLTRFENSGLECPVLVGDMGGGIGQARLRILRDVFRGLIEADNAGFSTGGAVFIALQPLREHVEDAGIHITEEERAAWDKKADASAVADALAETLQAAKEYTDEQARNLADSFAAALETAVSELKEEIRNTVATLIDNAPEALDTLQELSTAQPNETETVTSTRESMGSGYSCSGTYKQNYTTYRNVFKFSDTTQYSSNYNVNSGSATQVDGYCGYTATKYYICGAGGNTFAQCPEYYYFGIGLSASWPGDETRCSEQRARMPVLVLL